MKHIERPKGMHRSITAFLPGLYPIRSIMKLIVILLKKGWSWGLINKDAMGLLNNSVFIFYCFIIIGQFIFIF